MDVWAAFKLMKCWQQAHPMWVNICASLCHSLAKPKSQSLMRGGLSSDMSVLSSFKSLYTAAGLGLHPGCTWHVHGAALVKLCGCVKTSAAAKISSSAPMHAERPERAHL